MKCILFLCQLGLKFSLQCWVNVWLQQVLQLIATVNIDETRISPKSFPPLGIEMILRIIRKLRLCFLIHLNNLPICSPSQSKKCSGKGNRNIRIVGNELEFDKYNACQLSKDGKKTATTSVLNFHICLPFLNMSSVFTPEYNAICSILIFLLSIPKCISCHHIVMPDDAIKLVQKGNEIYQMKSKMFFLNIFHLLICQ